MKDMLAPRISIVIPCRNEGAQITSCLESVLAQQSPGGGIEILVADGMSDDDTRHRIQCAARTDERIRLVDNPGRIVSTGLNAAIAQARGKIVIRMDAHTRYAPDYVRNCVSALEESGADNVGGPWRAKGNGYIGRAIAAAFQSPFACGGGRAHDLDYEGPLDTVYLGCWRKETLERIGGYDESMVRNQDDELNARLIRLGGCVWQSPTIRSWYTPRDSLWSLFLQYFQYGYWKVLVIRNHGRPASWRHLIPVLFVFTLAVGWLPALAYPPAWMPYAAFWTGYLLISLVSSVHAASRAGWGLLPVLPAVFFTYHTGYGLGFGLGMLDFLILRRSPRTSARALTRKPTKLEASHSIR